MPERGFNTEFWTDEFVQDLPLEAKTLYVYLWTNSRCNQAGLYKIGLQTIANETGIGVDNIPDLIRRLEPKVKWYPDENLIWVKNFIKHQAKSPKFLIAAASRLKDINNNGAVRELLEYNLQKYSIPIPYTYSMDTVEVVDSDTASTSNANTDSKSDSCAEEELGVVKGEEGKGKATRDQQGRIASRSETHESPGIIAVAAETAELKLLSFLKSLKGWHFEEVDDLAWLREFCQQFPLFGHVFAKACRDYHSGREPPKHKGIWKNRFRNWMETQRKKEAEKRDSRRKGKPEPGPAPDWLLESTGKDKSNADSEVQG